MGIVLEIKEAERPDVAIDWVAALLRSTGTGDQVIVISFDHLVLKRALERHPHLKTEAITHARHADLLGVLKSCGASSVSIEFDMFNPDDGRKLHEAGLSNRVHVPRPEALAEYWRGGRDPLPQLVKWIGEGLIDTISGDDVPFIARLVARAGKAG
jgi:glycerophosphoryl diester phosphodiesterase